MYASILLAGRACAPAPPPPACPVSVDALTSARAPESPPELVEALVRPLDEGRDADGRRVVVGSSVRRGAGLWLLREDRAGWELTRVPDSDPPPHAEPTAWLVRTGPRTGVVWSFGVPGEDPRLWWEGDASPVALDGPACAPVRHLVRSAATVPHVPDPRSFVALDGDMATLFSRERTAALQLPDDLAPPASCSLEERAFEVPFLLSEGGPPLPWRPEAGMVPIAPTQVTRDPLGRQVVLGATADGPGHLAVALVEDGSRWEASLVPGPDFPLWTGRSGPEGRVGASVRRVWAGYRAGGVWVEAGAEPDTAHLRLRWDDGGAPIELDRVTGPGVEQALREPLSIAATADGDGRVWFAWAVWDDIPRDPRAEGGSYSFPGVWGNGEVRVGVEGGRVARLPVTASGGPDIRLQALHGATGPAFVWVHSADTVVLWTSDGVVVHEPERRSSFVHGATDVVVDGDAAFVGRSIWEPFVRLRCVPRPGGR